MTSSKNIIGFLSFFLCAFFNVNGQEASELQVINLRNPSFEAPPMEAPGKPFCCIGPRGWYSCGEEDLNTPDPQPGNFGVDLPAADANFYVGIVTRDNDTWEAISQRLRVPLAKGKHYTFSLKVSHSKDLISQSRITGENVKYNKPVKVRIWGGNGYCQKLQLLDETPLINHTNWKQYNFRLEPKRDFFYFTIEVFYKTPTPIPYNGNVLIDDASPIKEIPTDEEPEPPVVIIDQPKKEKSPIDPPTPPYVEPEPKPEPIPAPGGGTGEVDSGKQPPRGEKILPELDPKKIVEGQVIRIENLYFKADSSNISSNGYPVLDEIYTFLRSNPDISIEIGGHTNNRCETSFCNELSKKRAKSVAEYLTSKGIRRNRLLFKGYGKRNPVATNATPTGRKRNQRVEIKILSLNG